MRKDNKDMPTYKVGDIVRFDCCGPDMTSCDSGKVIHVDDDHVIVHVTCLTLDRAAGLNRNAVPYEEVEKITGLSIDSIKEDPYDRFIDMMDPDSCEPYDVFGQSDEDEYEPQDDDTITLNIDCEVFLGYSHHGSVCADGKGTVDLSYREVKSLVALIKEKGTSDINELGLKEIYPEIYKKLDEAYYKMSYDAVERHWIWEGFHEGCYEFDTEELIEHCERECGFVFAPNEDDYKDEDGNLDELLYEEDKLEAFFGDWLEAYTETLDNDQLKDFFYEHLNASVCMDEEVQYEVQIPEAIIAMAEDNE